VSPVSINGVTDHVHRPCPRCGYATRYKQWPIGCLCNKCEPNHRPSEPCRAGPGADGKLTCLTHARTPAREYIEEIWAEQKQKKVALQAPSGPLLRIADRYAAGRSRSRQVRHNEC
jgi:hypothetical protein